MSPGGSDQAISVPLGDAAGSGGGIGGADGVPAGTILAKCDVAEVIVYDVALSDPARKEIEHNLALKYGLPWTTTGVVEHHEGNAPESFVLMQNYPNPFNPSTTIGFRVSGENDGSGASGLGSRWVKLAVYDLLGREVGVLVNEKEEPGSYEVKFGGVGLSSGVYFYRLEAGDFVATKRLLLLK